MRSPRQVSDLTSVPLSLFQVMLTISALGFWGLPAYVMQGAYAELNKFLSRSVQNYIITSRVVQGERDLRNASDGEKADIIYRWNHDSDLKVIQETKLRGQDREHSRVGSGGGPTSWFPTLQDGRRQMGAILEEKPRRQRSRSGRISRRFSLSRSSSPAPVNWEESLNADAEFEEAIMASVRETSRGDDEEDAMVEIAIRESIMAMQQQGSSLPDPVRLKTEGSKNSADVFEDEEYKITDEEYQDLIEQAIRESLAGHEKELSVLPGSSSRDLDVKFAQTDEPRSSGSAFTPNTDDDADLQRAIDESRKVPPTLPPREKEDDEEEHFRRAIEASMNEMERVKKEKTEEEIVMEYVKKQSLAEEEFQKRKDSKGKGKEVSEVASNASDDDELKRAIEESLKINGGDGDGPSE